MVFFKSAFQSAKVEPLRFAYALKLSQMKSNDEVETRRKRAMWQLNVRNNSYCDTAKYMGLHEAKNRIRTSHSLRAFEYFLIHI